jgi:hypothetical protein
MPDEIIKKDTTIFYGITPTFILPAPFTGVVEVYPEQVQVRQGKCWKVLCRDSRAISKCFSGSLSIL